MVAGFTNTHDKISTLNTGSRTTTKSSKSQAGCPWQTLSDTELDGVLMRAFSDPKILTPVIAASIENALVDPTPKRKGLRILEQLALLVR
jgi:hypothetical protein